MQISVLMIGFYALLTRRDAFKIVIGLCLLENGVHMGLISLAPSIPETALIGVVTDVVESCPGNEMVGLPHRRIDQNWRVIPGQP